MTQKIHNEMYGKTERRDFSKIKNVLPIPYLIEVQKSSYQSFIGEGIDEVFADYSPISDFCRTDSTASRSIPSRSARIATPHTRCLSKSKRV